MGTRKTGFGQGNWEWCSSCHWSQVKCSSEEKATEGEHSLAMKKEALSSSLILIHEVCHFDSRSVVYWM